MPLLGSRRGTGLYYAREHRRARHDPLRGLTLTHDFGVSTATVDTNGVFPDRTRPITFGTLIEVTGASPSGIICEFGSSTNGLKLAIGSGKLYFAAGNGTGSTNDGVDGEITVAALGTVSARFSVRAAVLPSNGKARIWVEGDLVLRLDAASDTAMLNGVWADDSDGAVGAGHAGGSSTQRLPETVNGAPNDFALVEPFRVAQGQLPRQFD